MIEGILFSSGNVEGTNFVFGAGNVSGNRSVIRIFIIVGIVLFVPTALFGAFYLLFLIFGIRIM